MKYYSAKLWAKKTAIMSDFQAFVCPESLTTPQQVADDLGCVNIYDIFKAYNNDYKLFIAAYTDDNLPITLTPDTSSGSGLCFRYGYTSGGVAYSFDLLVDAAPITIFEETTTTKRWIIVNGMVNVVNFNNSLIFGGIWFYNGVRKTNVVAGKPGVDNIYTKYIHCENLYAIEWLDSYAFYYCGALTGTLTIPFTMNFRSGASGVFQQCNSITKVRNYSESYIPDWNFSFMAGLTDYYSYPEAAPSTGDYPFYGLSAILHLKSSNTGYDTAPWTDTSKFSSIIQDL